MRLFLNSLTTPQGAGAIVLCAAAALFSIRLGDRGVSSEELRWAQIAREMRQTGDFFHPTINGKTYYDKPLGSYWLIVAVSYLTGGVNETAARLPAALSAWLGIWLTMSFARRREGPWVGVLAGAILATSFGFLFYARRASADAETLVGVLAAVWLYDRCLRPGPWIVGLWAVMALTSLTKGLLGFALPILVFAAHSALIGYRQSHSWRGLLAGQRWLFNRWTLVALPMGLAIFAVPYAVSMSTMESSAGVELLVRENLQRFFAPHNHKGPIYLYVGALAVLAAPWSLFLPASLLYRSAHSRGDSLPTVYFWAMFAFFTLSASRRNYYILPILPPTALLIARLLLADDVSLWVGRLRSVARWLLLTAVAAMGLLLADPARWLAAPLDRLPPLPHREIFAAGWLISLLALSVGWAYRKFAAVAASVVFAAYLFAFTVALPAFDAYRPRDAFVAAVRERVGVDRMLLFHARDLVFDLEWPSRIPEVNDPAEVQRRIDAGDVDWIVARQRNLLGASWPVSVEAEEVSPPWESATQANDRMLLLRCTPTRPIGEGLIR